MRVAFASAAVLALCAVHTPADACSPPLPGVNETLPAEGQPWPGNAAVVLRGHEVSFDRLMVAVDDTPAAFVAADGRLGRSAFIEPHPAEGATVRISGSPCPEWADEEACPPIDWTFTAAAHDQTPPDPPVAVQIDLLDHQDVPSEPGLCEPGADFAYFVTVEFAAGVPTDRLVLEGLYEGEWRRINGRPVGGGGPATLRVAGYGPAPETPPCMRARVLDHAEQWSAATAEICTYCRARVDDTPLDFSPPYEPPTWGADDRVTDGECFDDEPTPEPEPEPEPEPGIDASVGFDLGVAGDGGPVADAGEAPADGADGGCTATPGQTSGGLWLLGLLGVIGATRRRSAR